MNHRLYTHLLNGAGFDVIVAVNGREAVDAYKVHAFDIVFMDIQMPIMDGLEATRQIRFHQIGTRVRTPIIAMTAGVDRERCISAGCDQHLQKPVRLQLLDGVLKKLFPNRIA